MRRHNWAHRREPAKTRAANQPHQKGLGLVVHRMSDRDTIAFGVIGDSQQEVVSNLTSHLLDASPGTSGCRLYVNLANRDLKPKFLG